MSRGIEEKKYNWKILWGIDGTLGEISGKISIAKFFWRYIGRIFEVFFF